MVTLLQWGRAFVGAEIPAGDAVHGLRVKLQWGRAFVGAEIGDVFGDPNIVLETLQWGRAFVGAEIGILRGPKVSSFPASMGPRLCGRGD